MSYALIWKGRDYVYIRGGIINLTKVDLANDYPHLIRKWKTKATARSILTRILNSERLPQRYASRNDYEIVEVNDD